MSRFAEPGPRRARRWAFTAALTALAVPTAIAAITGKSEQAAANDARQAKGATAAEAPAYHLRCWQYGRLIFEEITRDSPAASTQDVLRLHDRRGGPLVLLETGSSTCLITAAEAPTRSKSVPR